MILFTSVNKKYPDGKLALEQIDLTIEDGEFVFLVGPSGAGKTTLLRLLIREIFPTTGSVRIDDWEINRLRDSFLPLLRRKVSFVFQDFKLLSDRTVAENIAVSPEILGMPKTVIARKVAEVLEVIHLSGKENYFPRQLSYGEQQRVSIGRAIAGDAGYFLADEPTGNLDPKNSWEILKIISNINRMGKTVLMATHNVDIVNSMKKRVIMLKEGKIIRDSKKGKYT